MARGKRLLTSLELSTHLLSNAANWTQLTSTNIDASNIVAGTIDPERLGKTGKGTAFTLTHSYVVIQSSWEYALQSIRPTHKMLLMLVDLSDSSYVDSITITNGGTNYTNGTYQNIPM